MEEHKAHEAAKNPQGEQSEQKDNAPAPGNDEAASDAPGADVWAAQQSCIGCHGVDMKGDMGPDLTAIGSKLSADEIKEVIQNGRGGMPGGLFEGTDAELDQLVEYLAGLK